MIDGLLSLDEPGRVAALRLMLRALGDVFDDVGMKAVEAAGAAAALPSIDEDGLIAALRAFVHVSRQSDQFGFDVLGWLPKWTVGKAQGPVFLEVKNAGAMAGQKRSFKASAHEWEVAEDPRAASNYAFCLLSRDANGVRAIELLPMPATIARPKGLSLETDTWEIVYTVDARP